ncbi:MAG: DUF1232 domain-containing protein [Deltaproteobacteria bacterium]|nr:DUF1232 domain-containing protein [Deltaproteobacteria bacterium]MBW2361637.1 DUF1232 domain-containing protein [Deltaproteobacteria bacterium]
MSETFVTIDLNPREQRLYDRVRGAVSALDPRASSGFRDVVLLLPDLTVLLARLLRDPRVPLGSKVLALLGVGYVLSPIDLLPALFLGPLGWVDDLLVVSAALSRILNDVHPDIVRSHWSGKGDALEALQRVSRWSSGLLSGRVQRAAKKVARSS